MRNYVQPGKAIRVPAPYNVASGAGVLVGSLFGLAADAAASGKDVEVVTEGVFDIAKVSAQAWSIGNPIYWDSDTKLATTAAGTGGVNKLIGVAVGIAANPSSTGRCRLNGVFGAADDGDVAAIDARLDALEA